MGEVYSRYNCSGCGNQAFRWVGFWTAFLLFLNEGRKKMPCNYCKTVVEEWVGWA